MPFNDPDPTDPNLLVGVVLEADAEATRDMAYVFAEEFARLGYTREPLLWLFKNPFYGGAHGAYRSLGEKEILSIIDECLNVWGSVRINIQDAPVVQSLCPVQNGQPPPFSSPANAGEERFGGSSSEASDPLPRFGGELEWGHGLKRSAAVEQNEVIERLERFERERRKERDDG
jgi:hypothetical protein